MLQVASRSRSFKHKALLMSPSPPTDSLQKPDLRDSASCYPADAFQRMCLDPELIRTKTQFIAGVCTVLALILAAALLQWVDIWPKSTNAADLYQAESSDALETKSKPSNGLGSIVPATSKPIQFGEPLKRLSFHPAKSTPEEKPTSDDDPLRILEKFLAAATVDEKLLYTVKSAKVETSLRAYYLDHPLGALPYSRIERLSQSPAEYAEFRVVLRDGSKKFAAVISSPDGPRVDWASFVALGDLEWEQLRQTRPTSPVLMRVLATSASRFSGPFSDNERLRCIRLVPAADSAAPPVFGYVPKDSELARQLETWLVQGGEEGTPLTLRLCYPSQASTFDQAWITELVVPGWVTLAGNAAGEGE